MKNEIPRTPATELAWRQGDTANLEGNPDSENPYHPTQALDCWRGWDRGWHGWPLDERGGFLDRLPETIEALGARCGTSPFEPGVGA